MPFSVFVTLFVIMLGLTKLYIWIFDMTEPIYAIGAAALTLIALYLALLPGMKKKAEAEQKAEAEKKNKALKALHERRQCRKTTIRIRGPMKPSWQPLRRR